MIATRIFALVWTLMAMVGFGANLYGLQDARIDLEYVRRWTHEGTRLIVAQANLRRERVHVIIQTVFFVIGIAAFFTPQPRGSAAPTRILISLGFIVAGVLTVLNSITDRRDRKRVLLMIAHLSDKEHDERNELMRQQANDYIERHGG